MVPARLCSIFVAAVLVHAAPNDATAVVIHPDRRVTLQIKAPKATEVKLWGEWFTKFGQLDLLTKDQHGTWTTTIGPLSPGIYSYLLLLDGVAVPHPGNPRIYVGRDGFEANLLEIETAGGPYSARPVQHGSIHLHWYQSSQGLGLRRVAVYTPPGYGSGHQRQYPVLYLLHGSGGTESDWIDVGRANWIADNLLADGKAAPMLVVMPFAHAGPPDSPAREGELVRHDLMKDVLPFIERRYSVPGTPAGRALAGISMGGFQALAFALQEPAQFQHLGVFGAGLYGTALTDEQVSAARKLRTIFVTIGTGDRNLKMAELLHNQFKQHKIGHKYVTKTDAGHTWSVWRQSLSEFLPLLFHHRTETK